MESIKKAVGFVLRGQEASAGCPRIVRKCWGSPRRCYCTAHDPCAGYVGNPYHC